MSCLPDRLKVLQSLVKCSSFHAENEASLLSLSKEVRHAVSSKENVNVICLPRDQHGLPHSIMTICFLCYFSFVCHSANALFVIFLKYYPRKIHQSYTGNNTQPSCVDTSWALFTPVLLDVSTIRASS